MLLSILDTHLLLWTFIEPQRLSPAALQKIIDPQVAKAFSVVSIWEIAIKYALRRPDFPYDPNEIRVLALRQGFRELSISSDHVLATTSLPLLHRDPFDRLLVAQAAVEQASLITSDARLSSYPGNIQVV